MPISFRQNVWEDVGAIYLVAGMVLSIPLEASYVYAICFTWWNVGLGIFSIAGLLAIATIGVYAIVDPILRTLFWLPSLLWWIWMGEISFWRWLGPGFYVPAPVFT